MAKRGKGSPKTRNTVASTEPDPRDLEIYRELCKGRTIRDVAAEYDLSVGTIFNVRERVRRYLSPKYEKEIRSIKTDQTESLEHIFQEMMAAWEKSKSPPVEETNTVTDDGNSHTVKRKSTCGDTAYITQARGALADIRDIWDIEKHFEKEGQEALNPAGMAREQYKLKIAQAQLVEAQQLIAELKSQGVTASE